MRDEEQHVSTAGDGMRWMSVKGPVKMDVINAAANTQLDSAALDTFVVVVECRFGEDEVVSQDDDDDDDGSVHRAKSSPTFLLETSQVNDLADKRSGSQSD